MGLSWGLHRVVEVLISAGADINDSRYQRIDANI
jgi:hypothetical protein